MSHDTRTSGAKQASPLRTSIERGVSRRSFLRWGATVGGGAAAVGVGLRRAGADGARNPAAAFTPAEAGSHVASGITIVPGGCAHHCGGHCVLKAW
jgi:hypothetical protein